MTSPGTGLLTPTLSPSSGRGGALLIAAITLAAYLPVVRAGWVWDDDTHVTSNFALRDARGLRLIWTRLGATPQYYPLTHTTFWIERRLWGDRPIGYHLTNVILHALCAIVLWRILSHLKLKGALLCACIFAVHPINVESVAWVTERKNVLSGVFYMSAALMYLRGPYLAALLLFACALLSKTVTGTLPAALMVILWWKQRRFPTRDLIRLLPMFALALVAGSLTAHLERTIVGASGPEWQMGWVQRTLIAGRAVWFYAAKILVPVDLTFIYARWNVSAAEWWQFGFPVSAGCVGLALFMLRRRLGAGPLVAVALFVGTLFPALSFANVYPMRFSFVADHFAYLACVPVLALASAVLARLGRMAWAIPLLLGASTFNHAREFRDSRTLWDATLEKNPSAWIAHDQLGARDAASGDVPSALGHFQTALDLNPSHIEAHVGMANVLCGVGSYDAAIEHCRIAVRIRPDNVLPHYALGAALSASGDLEGAVQAYNDALRVEPKFAPARLRLAELLKRLGRDTEAREQYDRARGPIE
ncbi:MAG: tetratricopeptide repeat protein [Tepidisphaeraceae bacterium]